MNRTFLFATVWLTGSLLGIGGVRVHGQAAQAPVKAQTPATPQASQKSEVPAQADGPSKTDAPAPMRLTADQAYKANCTRCHSELPKLAPRAMKTVLMHMRVRANIPKDEARAILDYLTR